MNRLYRLAEDIVDSEIFGFCAFILFILFLCGSVIFTIEYWIRQTKADVGKLKELMEINENYPNLSDEIKKIFEDETVTMGEYYDIKSKVSDLDYEKNCKK